jgi:hypothetical protein
MIDTAYIHIKAFLLSSYQNLLCKTSSETTKGAATLNYPTLPGGGGGADGGLEVIVAGDGVEQQLLQLRLPLPFGHLFGLPAAALLDQLEDAGESLVGDEILRANPRARGT